MIKKFKDFKEAVIVGPIGPAYGDTHLPNKTIDGHDTSVIYSEMSGRIWTEDEWNDLYVGYLKAGGKPLNGFSKENIEFVLDFFNI